MADENQWAGFAQWVLSNPEKVALFLVLLAGAWRWLRELWHDERTDNERETIMEALIKENKELRKELREERRLARRQRGVDSTTEDFHD